MGGLYSVIRDSIAQSITNDLLTVIPATSRQFELVEFSVGGMGVASAANSLVAARSTVGTTPGAAQTFGPHREKQAAAGMTNATTWAAQPTITKELVLLPWNANGGLYRWVRIPGDCILFVDGDTDKCLSFRGKTGTSTLSFHVIVEEY